MRTTVITNTYVNGRVYHVERTGRRVIVDILQGTFDPMPGIRTDTWLAPR